ncbi:MAG: hypothetical protein PHE11_07990, partial [Candidatus Omnitrophica bacterium]|nr:hypothetical protein [Candidatus Omnitrophota bacterium]
MIKEIIIESAKDGGSNDYVSGLLFKPSLDIRQGEPLDARVVRGRIREDAAEYARWLLLHAMEYGLEVSIEGHLRGVDGCGSSLDLPEFQIRLTKQGAKGLNELPSTPTIASAFTVKISFTVADDKDAIEYVAPDYNIFADKPYVVKNGVDLVKGANGKLKTPKGQLDGPAYIFANVFGLRGIKIVCESIKPMALAGGMESSNVFNVALIAAASMLSGADLSLADIFSLAVKIENDEFGGLTGGQGHICCMVGGAYRHVWLSGIKGVRGELVNGYAAFSIPLLSAERITDIESHMALVQAGKRYKNGKADIIRTASLTNKMWTDLLRYKDTIGIKLHEEKLGLTDRFTKAIQEGDWDEVVSNMRRYVEIRDELTKRWLNLMFDAKEGKEVPEYAQEFVRKAYSDDEAYSDFRVLRQILNEYAEESGKGETGAVEWMRRASLYTLDPISSLVAAAAARNIAVMPLGAGGPGANLIAISAEGWKDLEGFLQSQGLQELTNEMAGRVIKGTGELRGYMPFKMGAEPLEYKGFKELGLRLPRGGRKVVYDRIEGVFTPKTGRYAGESFSIVGLGNAAALPVSSVTDGGNGISEEHRKIHAVIEAAFRGRLDGKQAVDISKEAKVKRALEQI